MILTRKIPKNQNNAYNAKKPPFLEKTGLIERLKRIFSGKNKE